MIPRFIIAPTGAVQMALMERSDLGDARVESCITQAVRGWTFPEPDGGGIVIVNYPIVLGPDGGSPLEGVPQAAPRDASAFAPAIAARASDDLLAVAYSTNAGVQVAWVRCR